jgi:hypothetical protein
VAQAILKPGLRSGKVAVNRDSNKFSLRFDHMIHLDDDQEMLKTLNSFCTRAIDSRANFFASAEPVATGPLEGQDEPIMNNESVPSDKNGMLLRSLSLSLAMPLVS